MVHLWVQSVVLPPTAGEETVNYGLLQIKSCDNSVEYDLALYNKDSINCITTHLYI